MTKIKVNFNKSTYSSLKIIKLLFYELLNNVPKSPFTTNLSANNSYQQDLWNDYRIIYKKWQSTLSLDNLATAMIFRSTSHTFQTIVFTLNS